MRVVLSPINMLPLFKTSMSLLRSILTLDPRQESRDAMSSDSIVDIAVENNLKEVCIVDDSISSLLPAILTFKKEKIRLIYGYRITFVVNPKDESEEFDKTSHKNIIFPKNKNGYYKLIALATKAATENFLKEPTLSYSDLHEVWDDEDLMLGIPFYDSFLHRNLLQNAICIPDFKKISPTFFVEDNKLPFDYLIEESINQYTSSNKFQSLEAKSVFYKNRKDFEAYLTIKCLNRKQFGSGKTLEAPNLDHMSSREFCWESYLENNRE